MAISKRILIVEDEILIAELLARYIHQQGHQPVGMAISFAEAQQLFERHAPDLVLIDVRLKGRENGIEFAQYLRQQSPTTPFIFLTSQTDARTLEVATKLYPSGYLSKPVRPEDLRAAITLALHRPQGGRPVSDAPTGGSSGRSLKVLSGGRRQHIPLQDILYLEADHVYVNIRCRDDKKLTIRGSLTALQKQLPASTFLRVHRSFLVNREAVEDWNQQYLLVEGKRVPISRSRWGKVEAELKN